MSDGARVLYSGDWYHRLAPSAMYEGHFEEVLVDNADLLCPGFTVVPFKETVESEGGNSRSDLALIEHGYRCWYVVEVELGIHSRQHVETQIRQLSGGVYDERHAAALHKKAPHLSETALQVMMKGQQPRVIVMVNEEQPKWQHWLRPYDAIVVSIEMYRSAKNRPLLRVIGNLPDIEPPEKITECVLDESTTLVKVGSPATLLAICDGAPIQTIFGDDLLEWSLLSIRTDVFLNPRRKNPLVHGRNYQIIRKGSSLEIIEAERGVP